MRCVQCDKPTDGEVCDACEEQMRRDAEDVRQTDEQEWRRRHGWSLS